MQRAEVAALDVRDFDALIAAADPARLAQVYASTLAALRGEYPKIFSSKEGIGLDYATLGLHDGFADTIPAMSIVQP